MAATIPASHQDLLDRPVLAQLACHMAKGAILVNPVWCLVEGGRIWFNSARGRAKDKALRTNPQATLCLVDPDNPFRYLELRGRVDEITEQGADGMIDRLAKKYLGKDTYPNRRAGEVRVSYRFAVEKARTQG